MNIDDQLLRRSIEANVAAAITEDLGDGDLTAALIPADSQAQAEVICREAAVLAGQPWFDAVFAALDPAVSITWQRADGDALAPGDVVCVLSGPSRALVSGERAALNFLQTLSGTATTTRTYVQRLGQATRILDTRKTLPGLRIAQKYAVACGGGYNHRIGLFDAVLIKENHIATAGSVAAAVTAMRKHAPDAPIIVEVENIDELDQALAAGADRILLDNFLPEDIRTATRRVDGRAAVEISGGVELAELAPLGKLGADFVSVGALTKHIRAVDFSMLIRN